MISLIHLNILRELISSSNPTRMSYFKIMINEIPQVPLIKLILFIHLSIYFLITIINCSLLNPGPDTPPEPKASSLNIFYQNIQGLIPFTELSKKHPKLDSIKISEIQAYVHDKQPDIIVLHGSKIQF